MWDLFPGYEASEGYQHHWRAARERVSVQFETFSPSLRIWADVSIYPAADGGLCVYLRDTTARKETEAILRRMEERFRLAVKAAKLGAYTRDLQGGEHYWSPEFLAIYGLGPQDTLELRDGIPAAVHPEDRAEVLAQIQAFSSDFPEYSSEHRIILPNGKIRWVLIRGRIEFDPDGPPARSYGFAMDISDRKEAEEALRERESFQRQMLESIPGMVFTTRSDGYCEYQSRQWEEYTGVPVSEHLGDGWNTLLHPEDRSRAYACWRDAVEGRSAYNLEYRVRRYDGVYEWFKVIGRAIRDRSGKIVRWFGVATNIHENKMAEEKLRQAKTAAEEASRAKSEFLANMSHEIRTPMTVTLGALELLRDMMTEENQRKLAEMASTSSESLLRLIDDILDFSKVEAGKMELHLEPVPLRRCLVEFVNSFSLQAQEKNLDLSLNVSEELPEVIICDQYRMRQVLNNLMGNAIKFTERGAVKLEVKKEKSRLRFIVRDTGIGIPPEKMKDLFESFNQLDPARTRKYGGTGLGLAISRSLVNLMGGRICAESSPGKGSIFQFTIPLKEASLHTPELQNTKGMAKALPLGARILLAEDDPAVRSMVKSILVRWGCEVKMAHSGLDVLKIWKQEWAELILMDVGMPEMCGLEAARLIREGERKGGGRRVSIVALTAYAGPADERKCLDAGMDAWVPKPIDTDRLQEILKRLLTAGEQAHEPCPDDEQKG